MAQNIRSIPIDDFETQNTRCCYVTLRCFSKFFWYSSFIHCFFILSMHFQVCGEPPKFAMFFKCQRNPSVLLRWATFFLHLCAQEMEAFFFKGSSRYGLVCTFIFASVSRTLRYIRSNVFRRMYVLTTSTLKPVYPTQVVSVPRHDTLICPYI